MQHRVPAAAAAAAATAPYVDEWSIDLTVPGRPTWAGVAGRYTYTGGVVISYVGVTVRCAAGPGRAAELRGEFREVVNRLIDFGLRITVSHCMAVRGMERAYHRHRVACSKTLPGVCGFRSFIDARLMDVSPVCTSISTPPLSALY